MQCINELFLCLYLKRLTIVVKHLSEKKETIYRIGNGLGGCAAADDENGSSV